MRDCALRSVNAATAPGSYTLRHGWRSPACCAGLDLRLAVDEVCTRLIRCATPDATLIVVVDPQEDQLVVEASAACDTHDVVAPGSFSWHVLTSLADDVKTFHDGREPNETGSVFGISLTARRAATGR